MSVSLIVNSGGLLSLGGTMNRRQWRMGAMGVVLSLALSLGLGLEVASAHPVDGQETDVEHAEQDLVGTPITEIERQTRANAARIKETTGVAPGGHSSNQKVANASLSSAAATDPGVGGAWSSVIPTDVVPIFQAVLPNGKVLMWDSVGDGPTESFPDHSYTRALIWDPNTNSSVRKDVQGYNIFCAGYTQLANGNVLVAGGNRDSALNGIVQTHIFDWRLETWSRGPDMAAGRWYPSVAALGNDEAVIVGGGPAIPEVYQTDGTLRRLTNASGYSDRSYPFLVPRPDGQVELVGPLNTMNTINTSGTGLITATHSRDGINRDYSSFATYDIGKVLVSGGGSISEDNQSNVPTKTAVVVDVKSSSSVSSTTSMSVGRRQHNLTVLADGSVLATGGQTARWTGWSTSSTQFSLPNGGIQPPGPGLCFRAPVAFGSTTRPRRCCRTAGCSPAVVGFVAVVSPQGISRRMLSTSSRTTCSRLTAAGSPRTDP
jgi:hypothetical protein